MNRSHLQLLAELKSLLTNTDPGHPTLKAAMMFLHEQCDSYHWVGIYVLIDDILEVGPYFGPNTDHKRIKVGVGVCGTAVAQNTNQIITDVRQLDNYLACNLETRSEIVVLIKDQKGTILGQIDVDGTTIGAFDHEEEEFLEAIAAMLAPHMPHKPS